MRGKKYPNFSLCSQKMTIKRRGSFRHASGNAQIIFRQILRIVFLHYDVNRFVS